MMRPDQLFDLTGRVVVVTGGAGLLGQRHCEAISGAGGIPVLADIHPESLDAEGTSFAGRFGGSASAMRVDVTDLRSVEGLLAAVLEKYGRIDVLINNAANNPKVEGGSEVEFSRLESFPTAQWELDLAVGLTGAFLCSRVIGAELARRGRGVIINDACTVGPVFPISFSR
jgi:NAD(P)-dependent dehydrogenase (short-subunit alcohol dehydrogenase family)